MTNTSGERLKSLTQNELCELLKSRVHILVSGRSSSSGDVYTHHVAKVVEVLNSMLLVGYFGDDLFITTSSPFNRPSQVLGST